LTEQMRRNGLPCDAPLVNVDGADADRTPARIGPGTAATRSVALVVTAPTDRVYGDQFFSELLRSMNAALAEYSLLPVMITPQTPDEVTAAQEYLLGGHVSGVILVNPDGSHSLPERLRDAGVSVVLRGTPPRGMVISYVDSDNRHGAQLAVEHLLSIGRRRIAVISGLLDQVDAIDRRLGYRDALTAAGIHLDPTLEEVADYLPERAHMAMERLLLNHPDVDAVFAASDSMAVAALGVLRQARKRIPEDVAVIGFDDARTASVSDPPLSSIRQHIDRIGRETVNVMLHEMDEPGGTPTQVIFPTELVIRQSTVPDSGTAGRD